MSSLTRRWCPTRDAAARKWTAKAVAGRRRRRSPTGVGHIGAGTRGPTDAAPAADPARGIPLEWMPESSAGVDKVGVYEDLLAWSATRPAWQRDALRRLVISGRLSEHDL